MKPAFLVPDRTVRENGAGEAVACDAADLLITLGILAVEEQESLQVTLWHSENGAEWGAKPVAQFAQKFYPGTHRVTVRVKGGFLQARWLVNRWGRGDLVPRFRFYVFSEPEEVRADVR